MSFERIIRDIAESQAPRGDRAYKRLLAVANGESESIDLSDHDLVLAIGKAIWEREYAMAQMGLGELEVRTAADAQRMNERRSAA